LEDKLYEENIVWPAQTSYWRCLNHIINLMCQDMLDKISTEFDKVYLDTYF
jgi:hypothetical protein